MQYFTDMVYAHAEHTFNAIQDDFLYDDTFIEMINQCGSVRQFIVEMTRISNDIDTHLQERYFALAYATYAASHMVELDTQLQEYFEREAS